MIGSSVQKLNLKLRARKKRPVFPPPGMPLDGIRPGRWAEEGALDETGCLPEVCPVRPLGYDGEDHFFIDTTGQVFNSGGKALGVERLQILFKGCEGFLYWAYPAKEDKRMAIDPGFKSERVRRDLFAACAVRGPWTPTDRVRGRGAWVDEQGELLLHCGEFLFVDGQIEETGERGKHFYARRETSIEPWGAPVELAEENPAVELFEILRTWNFVRGDTDVMLIIGWIGVALMGAALDWRPSIFVVGDAGTGKSELTGKHGILKAIFGRGMISTTNASSAGLYQLVGHDSLPISIDEIEGEDAPEQAQQIIKMARDAASGSTRIRGGADHKGVEFEAQSTFVFSAINPPPLPPASLSRLAVLQLRALKTVSGQVPTLKAADTVGPRLLRRVADHWRAWPKYYEDYRTVLRQHGHDSRGQNTFGTFLAAANLLLGDAGMDQLGLPFESLDHWGRELASDVLPELSGKQPNWAKCLEEILSVQVDAYSRGEKSTVGQILESLMTGLNEFTLQSAGHKLAQAGLGLLPERVVGESYGLAVPLEHRQLAALLAGTSYANKGGSGDGSWKWALRQGPENIVKHQVQQRGGKIGNRVTIGGVQKRCMFVSLSDFKQWQEEVG